MHDVVERALRDGGRAQGKEPAYGGAKGGIDNAYRLVEEMAARVRACLAEIDALVLAARRAFQDPPAAGEDEHPPSAAGEEYPSSAVDDQLRPAGRPPAARKGSETSPNCGARAVCYRAIVRPAPMRAASGAAGASACSAVAAVSRARRPQLGEDARHVGGDRPPEGEQLGGELVVGLARGQALRRLRARTLRAATPVPAAPRRRWMRRSLPTLLVGAAWPWPAPPARSACEVPLPGEPDRRGGLWARQHGSAAEPAARRPAALVAWASGYDLNPFNADRLGIYVAQTDAVARRRKPTGFSNSLEREFSRPRAQPSRRSPPRSRPTAARSLHVEPRAARTSTSTS